MDEPTIDRVFIDYSLKKLRQLASRVQDCLAKLDDRKVWLRGSDAENAIGNLVLHLSGNVRQWIVSGVGGAADNRIRDREFSARGDISRAEMAERLTQTIDEATRVLAGVTADRLLEMVTIQGYEVTVMECIYHVVEHFSGHTGQIIYATKAVTGSDLGFYAHLRSPAATHGQKTP
jgi:uncharacterized damage-inducible protein DinB